MKEYLLKFSDLKISLTSLRSRLILVALIGLLPVLGLVFYTSLKNQQERLASASETLLATAKLAALSQTRTLEGARQLLAGITSTPAVKNSDIPGCLEFFQNLRGMLPDYADLGIVDSEGKLSCNASGSAGTRYLGDQLYFRQALATQAFSVGEYAIDEATGRASIAFGMPVLNAAGGVLGVAFAVLDLEKAVAASFTALAPDVALTMMDRNGTIIATGGPQTGLLGTQVRDAALLSALKTRPAQTFEGFDQQGVARVYAAVAVGSDPAPGLYVVASLARSTMVLAANRQLYLSASLLAVLAAFGVLAAGWAGHTMILVPARRLLQQVNGVAGDDPARPGGQAGHSNELVELSSAFHRMADVLSAREKAQESTELALRAAQRRLRSAQRIGKIGNWEFDRMTNHVWWSEQTCEIYGFAPGDLASPCTYESVLAQVFPPDREYFEAAQKIFFDGIGALDVEHRIVRADGEVRWVHGLGESIVDADGRPVFLSGTVQDITERKLSDEARRESEAQFRLLTDAMPQIVWMMQPDGWPIYFNQKWLDYSGLSLQESLRVGWAHLVHPDDSLRFSSRCAQAQALGSDESWEVEYRLRRADGVYRWMLCRALPLVDATGQRTKWLGTFTDIDELKQATDLLEQTLSMQRIAGRVARLGGWTIDLPERTLTWSDENCVIHDVLPGYKPTLEEGIGYFLPEDRATVIRYVEACALHGTPYDFVLPKMTAKGRRIWVRSIGEAHRDATGQIVRIQGAFQDISEAKQAEARTLALETRLVTTLESITDGFYLIDKDWQFIFMNGQAERMLQRDRVGLLGKNLWQEFPETLGTRIEQEYRLTVQTQRTTHFEVFYAPLKTWFGIHAYPTEAGIAVYLQDITQRRSEQAQLRLLETAVSRLNDMVIITQAGPFDEPGPRIVFVNEAFERCTGYSAQEAIGNTPSILKGPKTQRAELDRIRMAMENWQPVRSEIINYTKSGKEFWLELDIAPIADESGKFTHWVAVNRDITERRRQQEKILSLNSELEERVLLRTAQLGAVNKELESFAYSVSHDLRSPLNTVDGFSRLLMKIEADNISEKGKHYLDRIGAGVRQMGELIEGLLTLAHLSREQLKSERVDLSAIARLIDVDYREREPARQAEMHIHDGLSAHGDPRLLVSVLQNLLDNAWKFTSRQLQARIEVGSELGADGETLFFVKDNGAGFDMAFAHKLFGTFERLHSSGDFSGTGIGLAIVKRVIERHGGRVWAQGKLNEGAAFYFTLKSGAGEGNRTLV